MNLDTRGQALVEQLKLHVLDVLQALSQCHPGGPGLGNAVIERHAGLALHLDRQDHWLCWSILKVLQREGKVEAIGDPTKWRLKV